MRLRRPKKPFDLQTQEVKSPTNVSPCFATHFELGLPRERMCHRGQRLCTYRLCNIHPNIGEEFHSYGSTFSAVIINDKM